MHPRAGARGGDRRGHRSSCTVRARISDGALPTPGHSGPGCTPGRFSKHVRAAPRPGVCTSAVGRSDDRGRAPRKKDRSRLLPIRRARDVRSMTDSVSSTYVGILGYGTMGAGIAQVAAAAGCGVFVVDVGEEALVRGAGLLSQSLHKAVAHGKLADDAVETILGRVESGTDPRALGHCHLVIEAVTELYDVKAAALKEISRCVDGEAIIATNTSSLSVTALAANVSNPGRFAGLHFFNPAPVMRLVEIIPGIDTAAGTVGRLRAWATEVGKEPVVVKDQPGFLVT